MSITEKRLNEIQGRIDAATDGPWVVEYESEECPPFKPYAHAIHGPTMQGVLESQVSDDYKAQYGHQMDEVAGVADADAELIAHAPTDLADLLAEVHRLREELAKAREVTEDKVGRVQKIMIDESFLAHEPDPHIRDVVREGIREQARLHVEAALHGGDDA